MGKRKDKSEKLPYAAKQPLAQYKDGDWIFRLANGGEPLGFNLIEPTTGEILCVLPVSKKGNLKVSKLAKQVLGI